MSLIEKLKETFLEDIKNIDLNKLQNYVRINHETIKFVYDHADIDTYLIDNSLEEAIKNTSKIDYVNLINQRGKFTSHADPSIDPIFLAYGIQHELFSKKQIKQIPFDHGETLKSFTQQYYDKELINKFRQELLSPPKKISFFQNGNSLDGYCCCSI